MGVGEYVGAVMCVVGVKMSGKREVVLMEPKFISEKEGTGDGLGCVCCCC